MKNTELSQRIKELRNRKGFSQEELSEKSGLSLRTIQRIEKGETEPRGDSLKRLASVFEVSPDEIIDWQIKEDKGFLLSLNLSALSFIIVPVLGVLVPLVLWVSRKDKIKGVNKLAKNVLNFEITWLMLFFAASLFSTFNMASQFKEVGEYMHQVITPGFYLFKTLFFVLYLYNIIFLVLNAIRINREQEIYKFPAIPFIRK